MPGQNTNTGVVTKQTIRQNEEERLRQQKEKEFSQKKSGAMCVESAPLKSNRPRLTCIADVLEHRRLGLPKNVQPDVFKIKYLENRIQNLRSCGSIKTFSNPYSAYDRVEHFRHMIPNADFTQFLCLWTLKNTMTQRIQVMRINSLQRTDEEGRFTSSLSWEGKVKLQHTTKVTHLCWADQGDDNSEMQALFTSTCFLGCNPSTAHLFKLKPQQSQQSGRLNPATELFILGPQAAWTCAWCPTRSQFSVGTEHCSMLLDVSTRRLWELNTRGFSVHAQAFSPQVRNL